MSLRRSMRDTVSCPTPSLAARSSCVRSTAWRRSFNVANSHARRSILARRAAGSPAINRSRLLATRYLLCPLGAPARVESSQIVVESAVRGGYKPFVEPLLVGSTLIASCKEDRLPLGIERECDSPHSALPVEA